ncbi:hypothetical protein BB559_003351 [Furculomyces boomerangus]|uniref:Proteasome alpha-type subunits domain-containing protein n=2 Tax=Harpellales TaxID=61421 RepID=A0A2T9YLT8_9FUNG|nr:hypothetical protein BB559_003351 [Furculomyces boomerangus]PVZ96563.1 hypothetical protein BB558_007530 [Smittium angustum]
MSYDRALTVFSPDGHLFQVDYAQEAVRKGTCAVSVRGKDSVVLGVEKKTVLKLQDPRTFRKIHMLDEHIFLASAGLNADARVLVDRARTQCQSHRLTVEDPATVEYITRFVAETKQKYTQSGGRRPFGVSTLIIGLDPDSTPRLFQTDPSGNYYEWSANCIGRGSDVIKEYLEKSYTENMDETEAITLTIKSLMEVVQTGAKNIEIVSISKGGIRRLSIPEVEEITEKIQAEKAAAEKQKKKPQQQYASLYFIVSVTPNDNELLMLELIHRYVEILDKYFGNVCELDLIFNFQKAYFILNEYIMAGEMQESSKKTILRVTLQQDEIETQENSERGWGELNLDGVAKSALLSVQEFRQSLSR